MFPYWLLFSVFAFGAMSSAATPGRRQAGVLFIIAGVLVTLMVGLRYQVGGDWGAYARMFDLIRALPFNEVLTISSSEPSYSLVNWLAAKAGFDIWAVNLICAAIFAWGLVQFARRQPQAWLCILVGTPFLVVVVAMGYTRQSAAVGLFLLSLNALEDRRLLKSVLLVVIAASFHRSAIIALPLIALCFAQNRIQVFLLVSGAFAVAYYALLASEWDRLTHAYIEQEYQSEGAATRMLMNAVPAVIFFLVRKRLNLRLEMRRIWTNLAVVGVASFVMIFLISATVALDRLAIYVIPLQMFLFSRLPTAITRTREGVRLVSFSVVLYSAAVQFAWLNYAVNAEYWVPYRSVVFEES